MISAKGGGGGAPAFIYLDYGPSPYISRELRYGLSTLLAEYTGRDVEVIVYTDKPGVYRDLHERVAARDISGEIGAMTRGGALGHRAKICVLLDALRTRDGDCVLLDTDSYILPGFADALARALEAGAAMDAFERLDPYPDIREFEADLPHSGRYRYDPARSIMRNSGLVAASPARHLPAIEDALALSDALLERGVRLFSVEQFAISESFRLHDAAVADMRPLFQHYFRRSLKRYMRWRIDRWMKREPTFKIGRPFAAPSRNSVRIFNWLNRVIGTY
jgi:hypothetical protein